MGLPWVRVDSNLASHDKIADLVDQYMVKGKAAGFVYVCALGYAGQHETNGLIKKSNLKFIHGTPGDAQILVLAGLWLEVDGGWQIKNYGNRNVVGGEHQAAAEATRAAQIEGGKKGADKRWTE